MIKLTRKDVCAALDVPQHRIRAWMDREPFVSRSSAARKARLFDTTDLLLLATAQTLEDRFKLKNEALDQILPALNTFLLRPQRSGSGLILIDINDGSVKAASALDDLHPGFLLDLSPERERVMRYLGMAPVQGELGLGLLPVNQRKR